MNIRETAARKALDPLWTLTTGLAAGIILILPGQTLLPKGLAWALLLAGFLLLPPAFRLSGRRALLLFFLCGLILGLGRAGFSTRVLSRRGAILKDPENAIRVQVKVLQGWEKALWGYRTRVRVLQSSHRSQEIRLPGNCRLEIRCNSLPTLPPPGQVFRSLALLKGNALHPLLVISSPTLMELCGKPGGLPAFRERLAKNLLKSAGVDVQRIRAAELAAALALGRRDFLPREKREAWRRGGAAHVLAVSGLHVGLIAGILWILGIAAGITPNRRRVLMILLVPAYAILAGAAPSALRACLMISLYLLARLLGRVVLPLATVYLAAMILLFVDPTLLLNAGFQLTIAVSAALIRWLPPLLQTLPLPKIVGAFLLLPLLAQLVSGPLIATHFRMLTPLAAVVNLAIPLLLSPAIAMAAAAVLIASFLPWLSAFLLDLISLLAAAFHCFASLGRNWSIVPPTIPTVLLVFLILSGILALRYDRVGKWAARSYLLLCLLLPVLYLLQPGPGPDSVRLLGVGDGTAALVNSARAHILFDGGHYRRELAELLADTGIRHLDAVIVSHADADHIGGIPFLLETCETSSLLLPRWLLSDSRSVEILRIARKKGCRVRPLGRGLSLGIRDLQLESLWPPPDILKGSDNDRSLVVMASWKAGSLLLTGDISSRIDPFLLKRGSVRCDLLLIPHHGSRSSTSTSLLDAVDPAFALIPAGPKNRHHHPNPELLRRLFSRHIPYCAPITDPGCGARYENNHWVLFRCP